ncbi:hypothetical protein K493DRAFT_339151 [Basidiobolus meristosporus CBS 931.73]|uniref:Uncharacterized protein n=1 Tax=Basidiobolus meristosporus CBS 931.73 TaxID=1314790 RepID=A0A1Y1Y218_9FUNG|nr:hypothetical protein K493DRAFT_339151 [Basidiobolus meristosporus CBS 931.73]|eukprot:ORX91776.1 hypothetical protein K493DRAFT_339151 [Basidiobolus meristosporus CBS 931.73]
MKKRAKSRVQSKTLKESEKQGQRTISSYFKSSTDVEGSTAEATNTPEVAACTEITPKRSTKATNKKLEKSVLPKHPKRISMLERWVIQKVGIVPQAARAGVFDELDLDAESSDEEADPASFKRAKLGYFNFSPAVNFYKQFEHRTTEVPQCTDSPARDVFLSLIDEPSDFIRDASPPFSLSQTSNLSDNGSKTEESDNIRPEEADACPTDRAN